MMIERSEAPGVSTDLLIRWELDCAEHFLWVFERGFDANDRRPHGAIAATRGLLAGTHSFQQWRDAMAQAEKAESAAWGPRSPNDREHNPTRYSASYAAAMATRTCDAAAERALYPWLGQRGAYGFPVEVGRDFAAAAAEDEWQRAHFNSLREQPGASAWVNPRPDVRQPTPFEVALMSERQLVAYRKQRGF